jgi:hypothetical protein
MLVKMRDDSQDDDGDDDDDDTWNRRPVPPARHRICALSPRPGLSRPCRSQYYSLLHVINITLYYM